MEKKKEKKSEAPVPLESGPIQIFSISLHLSGSVCFSPRVQVIPESGVVAGVVDEVLFEFFSISSRATGLDDGGVSD